MGDRSRQPVDHGASDERDAGDAGALPPESLLQRLLADPRTRKAVLKRLRARKARQQAAAAKAGDTGADQKPSAEKKPSDEGVGDDEAALATADAELERSKKQHEAEEKEEERPAERKRLGDRDQVDMVLDHTHEDGDEYKKVSKVSGGATVDGRDVRVGVRREAGTENDEDEYAQATSFAAGAGLKDGQVAVDAKTGQLTGDEHGAHETSQSVAYDHGKLKLGAESKRETRRTETVVDETGKEGEVTRTSSRAVEGGIELGNGHVGADLSVTKQNESGSSRRTGAGIELSEDGASARASQTWTSQSGKSVSVSVHAGVEVHTSDPVKLDDTHFAVEYERTVGGGGGLGGGAHGIGGSVGKSKERFQTGTRVFASLEEALAFKEHAAELLADAADPGSVEGAKTLEVGESRGSGEDSGWSAGVSGAIEGASIGYGHHSQSGHGLSVHRRSKTEFEVTYTEESSEGGGLSEHGLGIGLSRPSDSGKQRSVTVRFDLSTPEGQRGFEEFCQNPRLPTDGNLAVSGGAMVAREAEKRHSSSDRVGIAGLVNDTIGHETSETTRYDERGKHEAYHGTETHDSDPSRIGRIFGAQDLHSSVEITSRQENDKEAGYEIVGKVSGESGKYNRGKLQHLFGRDENWDESKVQPSGEWTMSAEIDKKTIHALEKYKQRFQGKSDDDKMRELGQWVADDGADAVNKMEGWGDRLAWDLELKGDPNFPGRAGREAFEARTKEYGQELGAANVDSAAVASQLQGEMDRMAARRAAVADTSRYTDLPDGLRRQQLQLIDREAAALESLRHRALIQAMRGRPQESAVDIATRANSPKGYDGASPEEKPVAQLRDQIALQDFAMAGYQKECGRADPAIRAAAGHLKELEKPGAQVLFDRANKAYAEAKALDAQQRERYEGLDNGRLLLLSAPPPMARWAGEQLLSRIQECVTIAANAQGKYYDAARALVLIANEAALAEHADFWDDVRETMEPEDYALAPDEDDVDADAKEPPPKPVPLALDPPPGRR